jgi:hypothetical protein
LKVYPEKTEDFQKSIVPGALVEFINVKQYLSGELNFVFRMDFRPQNVIVHGEEPAEVLTSFKKRLASSQGKDLIQATQLTSIDPRTVVRRCLKVARDLKRS